jgi:ABC-2 type transport system ATP-binding protein
VADVRLEGAALRFSHQGDQASEAALLREMILAGFPVAEFGAYNKSLEEVFLQVTQGAVQ